MLCKKHKLQFKEKKGADLIGRVWVWFECEHLVDSCKTPRGVTSEDSILKYAKQLPDTPNREEA